MNKITEHHIYKRLARTIKSPENQKILMKIAADEHQHYHESKTYIHQEVKLDRFKLWFYFLIGRLFKFTFGIKLMEHGEEGALSNYEQLIG